MAQFPAFYRSAKNPAWRKSYSPVNRGLINALPSQPEITAATMLGYLRLRQPETLTSGRYPALEVLSDWAEAHAAFKACLPTPKEIGGSPQEAEAALLRLQGSGQSR